MSCHIPVEQGIKEARDCKCYKAVMRTYHELVTAGQPESIALDAAKIVYGYHHPEDTTRQRSLTVERWINAGNLH